MFIIYWYYLTSYHLILWPTSLQFWCGVLWHVDFHVHRNRGNLPFLLFLGFFNSVRCFRFFVFNNNFININSFSTYLRGIRRFLSWERKSGDSIAFSGPKTFKWCWGRAARKCFMCIVFGFYCLDIPGNIK